MADPIDLDSATVAHSTFPTIASSTGNIAVHSSSNNNNTNNMDSNHEYAYTSHTFCVSTQV
jgi:hypothetical protein